MILSDYMNEPSTQRRQISMSRASTRVLRCHTEGVVDYNVGMHTANMMHLLLALWEGDPPINLVRAIMAHDVPEILTGDIPHPAKMESRLLHEASQWCEAHIQNAVYPENPELNRNEEEWLKSLDVLELYLWGLERYASGDHSVWVRLMISRIRDGYFGMVEVPIHVEKFVNEIHGGFGWAGVMAPEIAHV